MKQFDYIIIMNDEPNVVAVILNWNNYEDTKECIDSITNVEYNSLYPVIVDNGSTDGSCTLLEQDLEVPVICLESNYGFAGGINRGIDLINHVEPDLYWILNNDTTFPEKDLLSDLVEEIGTRPKCGIVSPVIRDTDTGEIWFEEGTINWSTGQVKHTQNTDTDGDIYVPFAAALIDADLYHSLNGLYEEYFLYYEDVDFCIRAQDLGQSIAIIDDTAVLHKGSASSGNYGEIKSYYQPRNRILFIRNYYDRINKIGILYQLFWFGKNAIEILYKGGLNSFRAFITGVIDGVLNKNSKGPYP